MAAGLSAVVALGLAACGSSGSGGSGSDKKINVAHFVAIQANPLEQVVIKSAKAEAAKEGASITTFDSNNDVQKEIANCNDAIASGKYQAFVLKAVSGPPLMSCARQAMAAGIKVVAQGTALGPKQTTAPQVSGLTGSAVTLSTTNGVAIADLTGKACASLHVNPCNVIYTFGPLSFDYSAITRKTFNDTVAAKYPNVKVVAQGLANFDPDTGASLIRQLVQVHPEVNVVVNDSDQVGVAVAKVLRQLHKDKVLVIGGAGSSQGVDGVKSGALFGDTVILPESEARAATKMAIHAARGEPLGDTTIDVTKDLSPVGTAVDKANVAKFKPQY